MQKCYWDASLEERAYKRPWRETCQVTSYPYALSTIASFTAAKMMSKALLAAAASLLVSRSAAQFTEALEFSTGFNSSFTLTPAQIESAQLDAALVESIQVVMNFDRSQLAFGGPAEDDFYSLPPFTNATGPLQPGQVLKVQPVTDPTVYAIPPNTALSRIMYTTTNFNGTVIPTTGFILWPYTPRIFPGRPSANASENKAPLVVWAHGTSGFFQAQAPSAHRGLWYDDAAPFTLAKSGYAVFAPDFAGLGISTSWDGTHIPHQYNMAPAQAADTLYGVRAALEAFSDKLSAEFVVIGHSQGGGTAWGVAEALAVPDHPFTDLIAGFKGSVAVSPATKSLTGPSGFMVPTIGQMLQSVFPSFDIEDWLTPLGAARLELLREVQGSGTVFQQLFFSDQPTVRSDYNESWYADGFSRLGDAGRRDFKGPMLVVQGDVDTYVPYEVTHETVEATWELFPDNDLELLVAHGVSHVPVLFATSHLWLQWIEDRLSGKPLAQKGNVRTEFESFLPGDQYQKFRASSYLWANLPGYMYHMPLSI